MNSTTHTILALILLYAFYTIGYVRASIKERDIAYTEIIKTLIDEGVLKIKEEESDEG